jgi:hypothetical protein
VEAPSAAVAKEQFEKRNPDMLISVLTEQEYEHLMRLDFHEAQFRDPYL